MTNGNAGGLGGISLLALCLVLTAAACNRSENRNASANGAFFGTENRVAETNNSGAATNNANAEAADADEEAPEADGAQEEHEDRSGPTRQARCEINDEAPVRCSFTPVLGDGSFDIDTPDRQLRLVIDGNEAAPFERIGARRIPLPGLLRRDPDDRACWITDDPDATLTRVCAR